MTPSLNYFVCTLGQAARLNQTKSYRTIPEFIDHQAWAHPDLPAIGLYHVEDGAQKDLRAEVHTFKQVQQGVRKTAKILRELADLGDKRQIVALLCPSSAGLLYSWLALIYIGHSVLLIAPQCSASAISHLYKATNTSTLFYDHQYSELVNKAGSEACEDGGPFLVTQRLPFRNESGVFSTVQTGDHTSLSACETDELDVAYLHHTSGTSSGLPKPIHQTHHGGLGVLPQLDGTNQATFTTTPLYHGGVADLFRAWTSQALIWLFPGRALPITATNIAKCLDTAAQCSTNESTPPVTYFSSVPYVLQMMSSEAKYLKYLCDMRLVGVGGAALPAETGDDLVKNGVNLISRFGSVECGFLMSSNRDFEKDQEWRYLRLDGDEDRLSLEEREDGLCELIVRPQWPHLAKRNRDDGSFATADLLEAHPQIQGAWRYHSRADAQLTLVIGKKFDPAPLEAAITASSSCIDDVLIFGNDRPYPGALLFPSADCASTLEEDLISQVAGSIDKLNAESQSHARISKEMLVVMPHDPHALEKSSKGTIMRAKAEQRYSQAIESAYEEDKNDSLRSVSDSDVPQAVLDIVNSVLTHNKKGSNKLDHQSDLFASGLDSVASIQIRQALSRLLPKTSPKLPMTGVEDTGTVARLSDLILNIRHGKQTKPDKNPRDMMLDLVQRYSSFPKSQRLSSEHEDTGSEQGFNVLLTGPTGSLGSHVLHQLLQNSAINHVYLLVRGASVHAATERVVKAFKNRDLVVPPTFESAVTVLPCKLSSPDLGISMTEYLDLAEKIDVIAHLAWAVNFLLPLRAFTAHLDGLRNLLDFALSSSKGVPPRFLFCSTVASVSQAHHPITEAVLSDPTVAGPTGYARSKWVAEQVCLSAHQSTLLHDRLSVVRVGQLSGATDTGAWANSEAYPLILSMSEHLGCLPDLDAARAEQNGHSDAKEWLNWLPVDFAARAFVELTVGKRATQQEMSKEKQSHGISTLHLVPPPNSENKSWSAFINVISEQESQKIKLIPVAEWLDKLEILREREETSDHPALKLASFWRNAYCAPLDTQRQVNGTTAPAEKHRTTTSTGFEMALTLREAPSLQSAPGLNEEYILKLWHWITKNGRI